MDNESYTAGEQVSQDVLAAILKLVHSGSSPETISFFLGLNTQTVLQIIAPMHRARTLQSIREKSKKYRCVQSNRLMISPVMARDENYYEQSILETDPSLSIDQFIPSKKLKAKITAFSKESLKELEGYLRQKDPQEDVLELTAECLSVLSLDVEMENAFRVLGAVEGRTARKLIGKLKGLVPEEMLISLMNQLARELPSHALCLAALIIIEPNSERTFEKAFRCFTELLRQAALGTESIDFAEEVSKRLNSSQLSQMNAALRACPRDGEDRLDGLRLKEAYALLREGEVDAAICLVNTLQLSPRLELEVLRFYDEAGLSSVKVPILEQRLSAKLEEISRDSPSLAETLSILSQLLKADQESLTSLRAQVQSNDQALNSLSGEVLRLNRELTETKHLLQDTREALNQLKTQDLETLQIHDDTLPTFIYSYDTDRLHRTNLVTGEQSSHQVPGYQFKSGCCWSEVPGGSLLITGGGYPAVSEVVNIEVKTFEVSPQPHMLTPRSFHAAVYHAQHLYVLGGHNSRRYLSECERYASADNRWEALYPLPRACWGSSGVVVESSLYALGGFDGSNLDLVQKLSLEKLTWELMQLKLPHAGLGIPCFKLKDTEVYLVVNKTLCSFTALQVRPIKTLTEGIESWYGVSYYHRGTLYCSTDEGAVRSYGIVNLSNPQA
jgi:hypothetical protein